MKKLYCRGTGAQCYWVPVETKNEHRPFASITHEVDSIRHKADSIHQDELPEEP